MSNITHVLSIEKNIGKRSKKENRMRKKSRITLLAESAGLKTETVRARLKRGLTIEQATSPILRPPFIPAVCAFSRDNHKGISHKAMASAINKKFRLAITERQILSYYKNHHLNSGLTGRFEKGSSPANKGKSWDDFMEPESQKSCRRTCFKKGHRPHNSRPVGSEVVHKDGYVWVKVAEPNKCRQKQRLVWEEAHGKIPSGMFITFLDENPQNCALDNLALISKEENGILNKSGFRFDDPDLTKTGVAISKLKAMTTKKEKKENGN
jgi:hypothetical protein